MRATAENPRVASLMGIRPDMVISATFIIGAVLAAIAGVMYASNYGIAQHAMGFGPGLKAFTAAVFGGIGNLAGAVVGGILLGLIEAIGAGNVNDSWDVRASSMRWPPRPVTTPAWHRASLRVIEKLGAFHLMLSSMRGSIVHAGSV